MRHRTRFHFRRLRVPTNIEIPFVICAIAFAAPTWAHHSHSGYDLTTWTTFEGIVTEVHWLVPHSWIYLDVKDDKGEVITWALEADSPASIMENGVNKEDVRPRDRIKVRCHLLRDGSRGCLLGFVTPLHEDAARGHGIEREWD